MMCYSKGHFQYFRNSTRTPPNSIITSATIETVIRKSLLSNKAVRALQADNWAERQTTWDNNNNSNNNLKPNWGKNRLIVSFFRYVGQLYPAVSILAAKSFTLIEKKKFHQSFAIFTSCRRVNTCWWCKNEWMPSLDTVLCIWWTFWQKSTVKNCHNKKGRLWIPLKRNKISTSTNSRSPPMMNRSIKKYPKIECSSEELFGVSNNNQLAVFFLLFVRVRFVFTYFNNF